MAAPGRAQRARFTAFLMYGVAPSVHGRGRYWRVGVATRMSGRAYALRTAADAWYGRSPPTSTLPMVTPLGMPGCLGGSGVVVVVGGSVVVVVVVGGSVVCCGEAVRASATAPSANAAAAPASARAARSPIAIAFPAFLTASV